MTAFGSCRGAGPLPRDVEQRGKNRRRFHTSPRIRVGGVERVDRSGAHARRGSARRIGRRSLAPAIQGRPPGVRTTRAGSMRARLKPRIGRVPRPTQASGLPGGFDRCSGATRREVLALPLVPRRGRASGDGVGRGEGPTDGPRGVFRASRAAGRAIMRRLTDWRWRLASYTPDRLHLADESSRQTGAVGGNCELANFYSNRHQRPTNRTVCLCPSRICPRGSANGPHPLRNPR